jgi:hypothetical protein
MTSASLVLRPCKTGGKLTEHNRESAKHAHLRFGGAAAAAAGPGALFWLARYVSYGATYYKGGQNFADERKAISLNLTIQHQYEENHRTEILTLT